MRAINVEVSEVLKKLDCSAQIDFCSFLEDAQSFKSQEIRVKLKRMYFVVRPCKPTNTRLKHQSEQFWVAEKTTKGGAPPPCVFFLAPKFLRTAA